MVFRSGQIAVGAGGAGGTQLHPAIKLVEPCYRGEKHEKGCGSESPAADRRKRLFEPAMRGPVAPAETGEQQKDSSGQRFRKQYVKLTMEQQHQKNSGGNEGFRVGESEAADAAQREGEQQQCRQKARQPELGPEE